MVFFFVFIIILSVYQIYRIYKEEKNRKTLISLYVFFLISTIASAVFYYLNQYDKSLTYYLLEILNINY